MDTLATFENWIRHFFCSSWEVIPFLHFSQTWPLISFFPLLSTEISSFYFIDSTSFKLRTRPFSPLILSQDLIPFSPLLSNWDFAPFSPFRLRRDLILIFPLLSSWDLIRFSPQTSLLSSWDVIHYFLPLLWSWTWVTFLNFFVIFFKLITHARFSFTETLQLHSSLPP